MAFICSLPRFTDGEVGHGEKDKGRIIWESPKTCILVPSKPYFLLFYYLLHLCEGRGLETSRTLWNQSCHVWAIANVYTHFYPQGSSQCLEKALSGHLTFPDDFSWVWF